MKSTMTKVTEVDEPETLSDDLPEGWASASALHLSDLIRGVSFKQGEALISPAKDHVPLLRANNINSVLCFTDLQYVPQSRVSDEQMLKVGDVVVAMSSGSKKVVGKAASLSHEWNGTFGAFCSVLRPVASMDWRYFGFFFQTSQYRDLISEASAGVNINNLKLEHFEAIDLPIPPVAEQQRIAAKIEELLKSVNASRKHLAKVPSILRAFRQSVLAAACSGRLTEDWRENNPDVAPASANIEKLKKAAMGTPVRRGVPEIVPQSDVVAGWQLPETWACYSAAELLRCGAFTDVKDGNHGANHPKVSDFTDTGLAFITAAQVNDYRVDYDGAYKLSGEPLDRIRVGLAKPGDVIYSMR